MRRARRRACCGSNAFAAPCPLLRTMLRTAGGLIRSGGGAAQRRACARRVRLYVSAPSTSCTYMYVVRPSLEIRSRSRATLEDPLDLSSDSPACLSRAQRHAAGLMAQSWH